MARLMAEDLPTPKDWSRKVSALARRESAEWVWVGVGELVCPRPCTWLWGAWGAMQRCVYL